MSKVLSYSDNTNYMTSGSLGFLLYVYQMKKLTYMVS